MPPTKKIKKESTSSWELAASIVLEQGQSRDEQDDLPRQHVAKHPLAVCMIPIGNWAKNVRAVVARDVWDALRYYLLATKEMPAYMRPLNFPRPNWRSVIECRCCGARRDNLELHEVWDFDDAAKVQRLVEFIPICDLCHNVIHFGRASQLGLADEALEHLRTVNGMSKAKADKHVKQAYAEWEKRSVESYSVDMNYLKSFLPEGSIHLDWLDKPKHWSGNRLDAIGWAKSHLAQKDALILDTETTGLISGPNKNPNAEVIELAIVSMAGKVLYESRFKPKRKVPKATTAIHGIVDADLADCPRFADEHAKILAILSGRTVISYNDRFDSGVIAQTCSMFNLAPPDCRWECAMRMYRAFIESARFVKLPGAKHGALADCKATLKLMKAIAKG